MYSLFPFLYYVCTFVCKINKNQKDKKKNLFLQTKGKTTLQFHPASYDVTNFMLLRSGW